jgi:ABC-type Mn2+/Zn2+ transport system ATPase subunit
VGQSDRGRHTLTPANLLLTVDALVAGYTHPVVGPLSFQLARGEIVALTGPNGSGKTTVLNAIVGTASVFGGRVVRDRSVPVAVLRQFPVHLQEMPILGREFVRIAGAGARQAPVAVRPLLDRRLDRLSGGQYQLLMVWACVGSGAGLVMLDEPTNNMDSEAVVAVGDLLTEAAGRGQGVLVISHEETLLARIASREIAVGRP